MSLGAWTKVPSSHSLSSLPPSPPLAGGMVPTTLCPMTKKQGMRLGCGRGHLQVLVEHPLHCGGGGDGAGGHPGRSRLELVVAPRAPAPLPPSCILNPRPSGLSLGHYLHHSQSSPLCLRSSSWSNQREGMASLNSNQFELKNSTPRDNALPSSRS